MLSSPYVRGGVSAANPWMFISANPSPSSAPAASPSAAIPAAAAGAPSDANDPTATIKSILAEALTEPTPALAGWPVAGVALSAYAAQLDDDSETDRERAGVAGVDAARTFGQTSGAARDDANSPVSVAGVPATGDLGSSARARQSDGAQPSPDPGAASGFSIDGFSPPTSAANGPAAGDFNEQLELNLGGDGMSVGVAFNLFGLDEAQARQINAAFAKAASSLTTPTRPTLETSSSFAYYGSPAPGFVFSASAGYY